jgi:histone acetyltransferase (RNA polymerase elongator complex component)
MNKKIKIIPIFVPHAGCPNQCVFCNQRRITGRPDVKVDGEYVRNIVEKYIETIDKDTHTEIAFFGGSFTAIDPEPFPISHPRVPCFSSVEAGLRNHPS